MMFQQFLKKDNEWQLLLKYTRMHVYTSLQRKIVHSYKPYRDLCEIYSEKTGREIRPISEDYLNDNHISSQNTALLRNAIQLWSDGNKTSDDIAPVLFHYSMHCFISFFMYTFFRWDPIHAKSHGVSCDLNDDIMNIKIKINKRNPQKSIFQRFIDTWTLLGNYLSFSKLIPIYKKDGFTYIENENYLLKNTNTLTLKNLIEFNPSLFEKSIDDKIDKKKTVITYMYSPVERLNYIVKNYLIIFVASNISRYRPFLWEQILIGANKDESNFNQLVGTAFLNIIEHQCDIVESVFQSIINNRFKIGHIKV